MSKHSQSGDSRLLARLQAKRAGWVFKPAHFVDLGTRDAVASCLKRLKRAGTIRQLTRGLYDYPVQHPVLGTIAPSADAIARALVTRDAIRLQPAGAYAANLLGLSDQMGEAAATTRREVLEIIRTDAGGFFGLTEWESLPMDVNGASWSRWHCCIGSGKGRSRWRR